MQLCGNDVAILLRSRRHVIELNDATPDVTPSEATNGLELN
jgi:hypothetical protein